ncbi:dockerin type I domain-containing protein [Pseudobacteroides cellulosolvens]|uniref:Dockerin domain-containing protein n=1 Tax=Pseudobacteroides cellulosolvens ATCC 35603 = DSM 2933 TaxID=398512 RepID=A0A0L6JNV0_9FIRM|nr:dockerin type I domain-containing protein [Pseudobacteroides cellulosolvens]KNY27453.1 hypothetical protein Bccel_2724 [Pseudobacteroides cellulosolvens ATCC 35603 = DSM 2933]
MKIRGISLKMLTFVFTFFCVISVSSISFGSDLGQNLRNGESSISTYISNSERTEFSISDCVIHPLEPYIFIADKFSGRIIIYNADTGERKDKMLDGVEQTDNSPKCLVLSSNELFVGLGEAEKILIYDAETLEFKDIIITNDKFTKMLIGNDGYIYTMKNYSYYDSYYQSDIRSYSRSTKQEKSSIVLRYTSMESDFEKNNKENILYVSDGENHQGISEPKYLYTVSYNKGTLYESNSSFVSKSVFKDSLKALGDEGEYVLYDNVIMSTNGLECKTLCSLYNNDGNTLDAVSDTNKNLYIVDGSKIVSVYNLASMGMYGVDNARNESHIQLNNNANKILMNSKGVFSLSYKYTYNSLGQIGLIENVLIEKVSMDDPRPSDFIMPKDLVINQTADDSITIKWSNNSPTTCMIEYDIMAPNVSYKNIKFSNNTQWEESPNLSHEICVSGLRYSYPYIFRIHYKTDAGEFVSNEFVFEQDDNISFDIKARWDKVVYDSESCKAFAINKHKPELYFFDMKMHRIDKKITLDEYPLDICLSSDMNTIFIINGDKSISVYDTVTQRKIKDIPSFIQSSDLNNEYQIYYCNNRLYLKEKISCDLWIYDLDKEQGVCKYLGKNMGALLFSDAGKEIYSVYIDSHLSSGIEFYLERFILEDNGDILFDKELHQALNIDPKLDINYFDNAYPLILDEKNNQLFIGHIVFDTSSFNIKRELQEAIIALSPYNNLLIGTDNMYYASGVEKYIPSFKSNPKQIFFDKNGGINLISKSNSSRIFYLKQTHYNISGYIKTDIDSYNSRLKSGFKVVINSMYSALTDDDGYFEVKGIPYYEACNTNYLMGIYKDNYLVRFINNIRIHNDDVIVGTEDLPLELWAGDITHDGAINLSDFIEIAKSFNAVSGDKNYKNGLDLNIDGAINMLDVLIIAKHFNQTINDYPVMYRF